MIFCQHSAAWPLLENRVNLHDSLLIAHQPGPFVRESCKFTLFPVSTQAACPLLENRVNLHDSLLIAHQPGLLSGNPSVNLHDSLSTLQQPGLCWRIV